MKKKKLELLKFTDQEILSSYEDFEPFFNKWLTEVNYQDILSQEAKKQIFRETYKSFCMYGFLNAHNDDKLLADLTPNILSFELKRFLYNEVNSYIRSEVISLTDIPLAKLLDFQNEKTIKDSIDKKIDLFYSNVDVPYKQGVAFLLYSLSLYLFHFTAKKGQTVDDIKKLLECINYDAMDEAPEEIKFKSDYIFEEAEEADPDNECIYFYKMFRSLNIYSTMMSVKMMAAYLIEQISRKYLNEANIPDMLPDLSESFDDFEELALFEPTIFERI